MNSNDVSNYLIFGASSNLASEYISLIGGNNKNKFFGLSTRPELSNPKFYQVIGYEKIHEYSNIDFTNILIIASRNPHQGGSLNDFTLVNNVVEKSLNSIRYSTSKKPKLTFLSSSSVYDNKSVYINDETLVMPSDYYGKSKILLENTLRTIAEKFETDLLVCRLPVFLYNGVSLVNRNFLAKLSLAIKSNSRFSLTNPDAALGAVFDVSNLVRLDCAKTL